MKTTRWLVGSLAVAGALSLPALAQTAQVVGKVVDTAGAPIAGAQVEVRSPDQSALVYKGTTDKKGSFVVTGVLASEQKPDWNVTVTAEGHVPVKAKYVARTSDKVRYADDEKNLSAKSPAISARIKAFSEVRVEFTMAPGEPEAAAAGAVPAGDTAGADILSGAPAAPAAGAPAEPGAEVYAAAIDNVRKGNPEASVDLFKQAIEAKPDDWQRRDLFAKVLLRLDRQGEATIQANKAVQLAPDKAGPLVTLTEIYVARGLNDKAAESIAKASELEPDNAKVLERRAALAAVQGNFDEAIALNEKVLEKSPNSTEVLVALADLYNRKKQPKKAEEMLNRVVALDPKNAYRTFYNLGVVILNREESSEADNRKAVEAFRKSIELKENYALAHRDLGFALLRLGNLPDARKELQRYVDLDPRARDVAEIKDTIQSLGPSK
jgi:tetratricopeptide (TPR) repeat protein